MIDTRRIRTWPLSLAIVIAGGSFALAQPASSDADPPPTDEPAATEESSESTKTKEPPVEMKATEFGIRFTPELANAMSKQFVRAMKDRYSLDDTQADEIRPILAQELMRVAQRTQKEGRDVIENMVATMVENDGRIPKEQQTAFAMSMKPILPEIKSFFKRTAGEVSKRMTVSQRMKFTGDMAGVTAGFGILENRMKKWEEGKHSDFGNPFFDPADRDGNSETTTQPEDPTETAEHRRARQNVERWIEFQINIDREWEEYVKRAIDFYKLNESQTASANSILKDMQDRAKAIKTDAWRKNIVENRIMRQMSYREGAEVSQGPWMFRLEQEYEKALKPVKDLDQELKARIESLPDSKQRETALEGVRKKLDEKGAKRTAA